MTKTVLKLRTLLTFSQRSNQKAKESLRLFILAHPSLGVTVACLGPAQTQIRWGQI